MAGQSWLRLLQQLLSNPSVDAQQQWTNHAIKVIKDQYGDVVSADEKRKSVFKFGMNEEVIQNVESDITRLPAGVSREVPLDSNLIDTLSTTDASFTGDIFIEGHQLINDELLFVTQTVTADGQNKVSLDIPLITATQAENADETLFSSIDDEVIIYENGVITNGVPDNTDLVHLIFSADHRQSLRAATAFSSEDYAMITQIYGDINKQTPPASTADILLRVRQFGEGFGRIPGGLKTKLIRSVSTTATNGFDFQPRPYIIIPKNSIVQLTCISSNTGVSMSAGFNTILARIQT